MTAAPTNSLSLSSIDKRRAWTGVVLQCTGWVVWWAPMFVPASWTLKNWSSSGDYIAAPTWGTMVLFMGTGLFFLIQPSDTGRNELLWVAGFFCSISLLISWWPVVFRLRPSVMMALRILGLSLMSPWFFVANSELSRPGVPPPGCGYFLWAIGSSLILGSWIIAPSRRRPANRIESSSGVKSN